MTSAAQHSKRRIAAWAACWLLAVGIEASAQTETPARPLELRSAVRIGPDSAAPQSVRLPETVDTHRPETEIIRPLYRLEVDLGGAPSSRIAVYLPGVLAQARIAINGQVVSDNIVDPLPPRPHSVDRLRLVEVPPGVVRPGVNTLEIALAARRLTILPAVWVGPIDTLNAMRDRKVLFVAVLPAIVATAIGLLGMVVLALYARRRQEPLYAYFGIGALAWALHTGWTILPRTLLSGVHFYVWWTALYTFFVSMLVIFCLRLTRNAPPEVERTLWAASLAAPIVFYAADAFDVLSVATDWWRLLLVGTVVAALAAVARHAWRRRDASGVLLVLTGVVGAGFGLRDWLVAHDGEPFPVVLTPYTGLLFIGLMAWVLIERFVRAADSLAVANRGLERRVASKSQQLEVALEEMRLAKEAAEHANRAKSSFLAAASHDLRQPIHALGLYMATLRTEGLNVSQRELVQRMSSSLAALDSMFNALLDISRMDAGGLVPHPRPFALEPMLHRLAEEFAPLAADKGVRLSVRVAPQARTLFAVSDPPLVERIVRNLLGNAVKYTDEGGVLLSCRLRGATRWRVEVWDSGCGIPESEREHVFDEFYQVGNPERDRANGLGLGLSIVRRLTQLMRHRLELHSLPGRGTRFALELPVTAERPEVQSPLGQAGSLQGLAVAVVDDDPEVRDGMQMLLSRWGCQVYAGADAAEVLKRAGERPVLHAIVADFRLRDGRTGVEAVQELREACGGEPSALIVTGDSAPDRLAEIERSTLPWLSKPVAAARLRSWLIQAARARRGADSFVELAQ